MNDIFRELKKDVDFNVRHNGAYTVVSQMLVKWCEARGNCFPDLIIKIRVDNNEYAVFYSFDSNDYYFVTEWAWYKDEDTIQILTIKRIEDVFNDECCSVRAGITEGLAFPSYVCESCFGEWTSVRYDYCPWCGRRIKYQGVVE